MQRCATGTDLCTSTVPAHRNEEREENPYQDEIEDFFLDNDIASYYLGVCQDFKHFGFAVSVIILSRDGTKTVRLHPL